MDALRAAVHTALEAGYELKDMNAMGSFQERNDAINAMLDALVKVRKIAEGLEDNVSDDQLKLAGLLADPRNWRDEDPEFKSLIKKMRVEEDQIVKNNFPFRDIRFPGNEFFKKDFKFKDPFGKKNKDFGNE